MSITLPAAVDIPSRTTGYAPYMVFFDASGTTSTATSYPFHECLYKWNFGDSGSGTWSTDSRSKNIDRGPMAAHVYETAGNYTWTLNVKDPDGTTASRSGSITVTAWPNDANTYCFSTTTDFTDAPLNSQHIQTSSFATIIGYADTNRRLLLHAGQTWTASGEFVITATGPGLFGKFGSGADPKIIGTDIETADTNTITLGDESSYQMDDWRFVDFEIDAQHPAMVPHVNDQTYPGGGIGLHHNKNILCLRLNIHGNIDCAIANSWGDHWLQYDMLAVVDCHLHHTGDPLRNDDRDSGGWGIYFHGHRFAILGNLIEYTGSHCIRSACQHHCVIEHNKIENINNVIKHCMKLHNDYSLSPSGTSRYGIISDNYVSIGSYSSIAIDIGPSNEGGPTEDGSDFIIERNTVYATTSQITRSNACMKICWERIACRNNIIIAKVPLPWSELYCFSLSEYGGSSTVNNVWIYNNTIYCSYSDTPPNTHLVGIEIESGCTNVVIRNNLLSFPNSDEAVIFVGSCTESNNRLTDTPGFVDIANDNYRLLVTSEAIDQGFNITSIYEDYDLGVITGTKDQGAFEYGAIPEDEGQSSLPSMVVSRRRRHE